MGSCLPGSTGVSGWLLGGAGFGVPLVSPAMPVVSKRKAKGDAALSSHSPRCHSSDRGRARAASGRRGGQAPPFSLPLAAFFASLTVRMSPGPHALLPPSLETLLRVASLRGLRAHPSPGLQNGGACGQLPRGPCNRGRAVWRPGFCKRPSFY